MLVVSGAALAASIASVRRPQSWTLSTHGLFVRRLRCSEASPGLRAALPWTAAHDSCSCTGKESRMSASFVDGSSHSTQSHPGGQQRRPVPC